jgi:hypothetical protein
MTVESLLARLREAALAMPRPGCDWESRPEFLLPPDAAQLEAARMATGEPLPDDLLAFLRLCGGIKGMSVHNGYQLCGAADVAKTRSDGWPPASVAGPAGQERVVPVAWDGGGNAFLLSPATGRVWRWDHETGGTTQVASSFTEFLARVVVDWEAYVSDIPGWRFLV